MLEGLFNIKKSIYDAITKNIEFYKKRESLVDLSLLFSYNVIAKNIEFYKKGES